MSGWEPVDRASRACAEAAGALRAAGVAPEGLAEFVPEGRRFLVLPRAATMRPLGEVWRLGTLLLGTGGRLFAAGRATRAAERGRVGYQSLSREERRDIAAAALHGGYPVGAPVNFDAVELPLRGDLPQSDSGEHAEALRRAGERLAALGSDAPVGLCDGEIRVRWRAGAPLDGAQTLAAYLAERVELLVHPPLGAN